MAMSNGVQGSRRPSPLITWHLDGTDTPMDLTNATLTGVIYNIYTDEGRAITGDLTITDADSGVFRWDLSAEDVEDAGQFLVQFTAVFPIGQTPALPYSTEWTIERALVAS
jgi:hypothetical protein